MADHEHDNSGSLVWGIIVALCLFSVCNKQDEYDDRLEKIEEKQEQLEGELSR
jgi:hypothetical protein